MGFALDQIILWGRTCHDYCRFFQLNANDTDRPILAVADGPASFNAEWTFSGGNVVSVDPVYAFSREEIRRQIDYTVPVVLEQLQQNQSSYYWSTDLSPEKIVEQRCNAMTLFLKDFDSGKSEGRYLSGYLPDQLPDELSTYSLVLCSHFLFTYSNEFSLEDHWNSILHLLNYGNELRIFPICKMNGTLSPYLKPILERLDFEGIAFQIKKVDYEFQKGGNQLLNVYKR